MKKPKSLWLMIAGLGVCIGCCSIPLYALLAGTTGLTLLWNWSMGEILKCTLPFAVLIAGYLIYRKLQTKKHCCSAPQAECTGQKCENHI